ncbi:hypothetical protein SEA_CARON_41 [Microbacterium phage Caron]|uniref:Uncharacterized protein n=1 Tax=Microbacterium phage Caron TaxID=3028494 RepID=A0AAE9ZK19_9CAUD|nr:hypothetical protein SEA_CARON_41 [Microbacterium phage Caron]
MTFATLLASLTHRKSPLVGGDYIGSLPEPIVDPFTGGGSIVTSEVADSTRHKVLIDLDVPAYLVESSTPGHCHLYIDKEVNASDVFAILDAFAKAGIVERGYATASRRRGYSALRLPWIKKTPGF